MAVMQTVQYNAHALPRGNQCAYSQDPGNERENSVSSASFAERYEYGGDEARENKSNTKTAGKPDTREVAIADRPANEVGM